jgi:hypothetical protein
MQPGQMTRYGFLDKHMIADALIYRHGRTEIQVGAMGLRVCALPPRSSNLSYPSATLISGHRTCHQFLYAE